MVTLEYDIDPQDAAAFQAAMVEVRAMRRRNGAVSWGWSRTAATVACGWSSSSTNPGWNTCATTSG